MAVRAAVVSGRRRPLLLAVVLVVICAVAVGLTAAVPALRAGAAGAGHCERWAAASAARAATVTGAGADVLVVGDSWSAGLLLRDPAGSWPSRLSGRVHVAGFSGTGYSRTALRCGDRSFGRRAPEAVRRVDPGLVVVAGGLNDVDQSDEAITEGFGRVVRAAEGRRLVVVGPALAPARARGVPRVDALLARLAAQHGAAYVRTSDLDLAYLPDELHLTPAGHRAFGDAVAARIAAATRGH